MLQLGVRGAVGEGQAWRLTQRLPSPPPSPLPPSIQFSGPPRVLAEGGGTPRYARRVRALGMPFPVGDSTSLSIERVGPGRWPSWWASSPAQEGPRFYPGQGTCPAVGVRAHGSRWMFLSHIDASLPPPFLTLKQIFNVLKIFFFKEERVVSTKHLLPQLLKG